MKFKHTIKRLILFVAYILVFAAIMYSVEKTENEHSRKNHMTLQNLWMNILRKYNMTREEFDDVTRTIHQSQAPSRESWSYAEWVWFMVALCTTIGYGNLTPKTQTGRLLTIIIALFGIPLTLMTLNSIGTMVTDGCTRIIHRIETRLLKRTTIKNLKVKCFVFVLALLLLILFAGATSVATLTHWSFVESFYFWFITLSTVGFGDYVLRGEKLLGYLDEWEKRSVQAAYLLLVLFGLALLASAIDCAIRLTQGIKCHFKLLSCVRVTDNEQEER